MFSKLVQHKNFYFTVFIVFIILIIFFKNSYDYFFDNKIFIFTKSIEKNSIFKKQDFSFLEIIIKIWPINLLDLDVKTLKSLDLFADIIMPIFLIIMIYSLFVTIPIFHFSPIIIVGCLYLFIKACYQAKEGEIIFNIFDKIVLVKPIPFREKNLLFNEALDRYKIPKDLFIDEQRLDLLNKIEFINKTRSQFIDCLDNYIISNFSNLMQKVEDDNKTEILFNFNEELSFFISSLANDAINFSFFLCNVFLDDKTNLLILCFCFIALEGSFNITKTITNIFTYFFKNNEIDEILLNKKNIITEPRIRIKPRRIIELSREVKPRSKQDIFYSFDDSINLNLVNNFNEDNLLNFDNFVLIENFIDVINYILN